MAKESKTNNNENRSAVIRAEVNPSLKVAYEGWWRSNGFASEADAIRWHARQVTGFNPESQGKNIEQGQN